jgi:AraC-like DNA-binding protein
MSAEGYWFIVTVFNLLGIAQGVFISIVLLVIKGSNRLANCLLSGLLFSFAIGIAGATLGASGYYLRFPHLIRVGDPFVLLIGPLFFLYARTLTGTRPVRKDWLHFLPFVLYIIFLIPFYSQSSQQKIAFVQQMQESRTPGVLFIIFLRSVFLLLYTYFTYQLLRRYSTSIKDKFSNIEKLNLDWLNQVAWLLFIVILCSFLMYMLIFTGQMSFLVSNYITSVLITLVIYTVGILGVRQARVFMAAEVDFLQTTASLQIEPVVKASARYEGSTLSPEKASRYLQKLLDNMNQHKPYLNPELSLQMLANQLDIPSHYLSQVINEQLGQNFFDFINSHRVEEVKARLLNPQYTHLTILAIAFDSGFNSKSAFNLAFKNQTGLTPSQYRAQHKKQ